MAKTREYVITTATVKFSTNPVEVRELLTNLANAASHNAKLEETGSPQYKTQLAISSICARAAKEIDECNREHWREFSNG